MNPVQLFINGQSRPAADGATFERFGPLSGQAVTQAAAGKKADAVAAVEAAAKAFPVWSASMQGPTYFWAWWKRR